MCCYYDQGYTHSETSAPATILFIFIISISVFMFFNIFSFGHCDHTDAEKNPN